MESKAAPQREQGRPKEIIAGTLTPLFFRDESKWGFIRVTDVTPATRCTRCTRFDQ
ncbi:hypothetical protein [Streptomyces sp. NPDC001759]